jgi:hypothetical protein
MKKTYKKIITDKKDIVFIIGGFKIINCYNSIANSYYGFKLDCFIETLQAFLIDYPNFLNEIDLMICDTSLENWLTKEGFTMAEPSYIDLLVNNR